LFQKNIDFFFLKNLLDLEAI
jgi:hypothetical protein